MLDMSQESETLDHAQEIEAGQELSGPEHSHAHEAGTHEPEEGQRQGRRQGRGRSRSREDNKPGSGRGGHRPR
jgi:hypothetical protein